MKSAAEEAEIISDRLAALAANEPDPKAFIDKFFQGQDSIWSTATKGLAMCKMLMAAKAS